MIYLKSGYCVRVIIFIVLFINILIFSVFKKMNTIYASIYEKEMIITRSKVKKKHITVKLIKVVSI